MNKKCIFFLFIIFILVLFIRLYHLSFFEFKFDQLNSIRLGNQALSAGFLITHGTPSGIGINISHIYPDFMGILTFFSKDPFRLTFTFFVINLLALVSSMFYFYTRLPLRYALITCIFLAFSPGFTIYANLIWPQSFLPVFIIILFMQLDSFIKNPRGKTFIIISITASIAAGLHMSGYFLFPGIFLIAIFYRKQIKLKSFFIAIALFFILFLPYLYYLIFENGISQFIAYGDLGSRQIYWDIFREHTRLASINFFRYYFKRDFNPILDKVIGNFRFIFYPLSCLLILFFITGIVYYLFWLVKNRRFFDASQETNLEYPVSFQIAGFMFFTVSLSYLILRVDAPQHYFFNLFPVYGLLMGFPVYRFWNFRLLRHLFLGGILATLILLISILSFLKTSGGHPQEYGLSYSAIMELKKEVKKIIPAGYYAKLNITFSSPGKKDIEPIYYLLLDLTEEVGRPFPLNIVIDYNNSLMRYEFSINRGE